MPDIPEGLVPARYKGTGIGLREGMPYYNVDGSRRESLSLEHGDEMLMRDEDIYGKTLLHDPQGNRQPLSLGLGRVVKPEHADLSDQDRAELGYEHHLGRPDFEPVEPLDKVLKRPAKQRKPKEVSQIAVIDQPSGVPANNEQGESGDS